MALHPSSFDLHPSPWRWWVCGVMMFATLLNYMDRQVLPQIATELKHTYGIDDARYGQVAGNFAKAFALGSVVFGFIADRIGPRLLYPVVLVGWSAAGLATPLMRDPEWTRLVAPDDPDGAYLWLLYCRTLLGFFEAGHWPCALLTARQILSAKDRPLGNGLLQSGASLGAILIPLYVLAVRKLGGGWEVAFWTIGAVGLLWVPVWLALVRRGDLTTTSASGGRQPPEGAPLQPGCAPPESGPRTSAVRPRGADAPRSPAPAFEWVPFVRLFATLFAINLGLNVSWQFIREWLPKYLKESQGFSTDAADLIAPAYYISAEIGCFGGGVLVLWLVGRGRGVHSARVTAYALFAVITAAAAVAPLLGGWAAVALIVLAGAGILGLHPLYYAFTQELPARHMALLGGTITAVGWYTVGEMQAAMGRHIQATGSYDIGFHLAGLAPLLGLAALLVLWKPSDSQPVLPDVTVAPVIDPVTDLTTFDPTA